MANIGFSMQSSRHDPVSVAIQIAESDGRARFRMPCSRPTRTATQGPEDRPRPPTDRAAAAARKDFGATGKKVGGKLSPSSLIRTYQQDVERKRQMVRKAEATRDRLTFVVQALRTFLPTMASRPASQRRA